MNDNEANKEPIKHLCRLKMTIIETIDNEGDPIYNNEAWISLLRTNKWHPAFELYFPDYLIPRILHFEVRVNGYYIKDGDRTFLN